MLVGTVGQLWLMGFILASAVWKAGFPSFTLFDDAMISMTYAKTFAATGELIWFEGAAPVQGFTNLLWTIFMTGIHLLGFEGSWASFFVSVSSAVLIGIISNEVRRLSLRLVVSEKSNLIANLAALSIFFLYPLVFWSLRGFEVGLLSLCLLLFVKFLIEISENAAQIPGPLLVKLGVVVAVGIAVRIDFLIPSLAATLVLILHWVAHRKFGFVIFLVLSTLGLAVFGVLAFQFAVYGDFLPNTYYLKLDTHTFLERLQRGIFASLKLVPLLLIAVLSWILTLRSSIGVGRKLAAHFSLAPVVAAFSYSVYVGGDAWEQFGFANRYFAVTIPLIVVLAVLAYRGGIQVLTSRLGIGTYVASVSSSALLLGFGTNPISYQPKFVIAVLGALSAIGVVYLVNQKLRNSHAGGILLLLAPLVVFSSAIPMTLNVVNGNIQYTSADYRMKNLGQDLKEITDTNATVAVLWAGSIPYYSERQSIDLLGKSDRFIARAPTPPIPAGFWNSEFYPGHNKYDLQYSVGTLRPDIVSQVLGLPGELKSLENWGYSAFCTKSGEEIFVLDRSLLVKRESLKKCNPEP